MSSERGGDLLDRIGLQSHSRTPPCRLDSRSQRRSFRLRLAASPIFCGG